MKKPVPDFFIKLDADDTDTFIAAVTKSLCNGWKRAPDIPAKPDRPTIYRFIRERPDVTTAAINLQRTDSETLQLVRFISKIDPMTQEEVVELLEDFVASVLEKIRETGIQFSTLICPEILFEQLMDPTALQLLQHFAAHTNKKAPLDDYEDRDRFQHFLIRLHRTEHRLGVEVMFLWATEEQDMPEGQAAVLAHEFRFGLQCLQLYDRYLAYRNQCAPELP